MEYRLPGGPALSSDDDPLGIALRERARLRSDAMLRAHDTENQRLMTEPAYQNPQAMAGLMNAGAEERRGAAMTPPDWAGFFQGLNESAPGGIRAPGGHGDPLPGLPNSPVGLPSTMWESGQMSAVTDQPYKPQQVKDPRLAGLRRQADAYAQQKYPGVR
jgi:hypothetical protein